MQGCDGSVLVNSTSNNQAEKAATPNLTLRGFDFIDRVKSLLEAECPGIVSCADTLALVARDSIVATVRILKKQEQTHFNLSFFFMSKEMD
jgi:peroxidase